LKDSQRHMKTNSCIITFLLCSGLNTFAAPTIAVDNDRIDFGRYPANREQKHTFTITNKGDKLLKITKVRKTCGCSETILDKDELKPGESASLTASIKAESIAGPFSKSLFIENNDPKQNFLMLTLNGQAIPLAEVKPQNKLYVGTIPAGQPRKQEFIIAPLLPDTEFSPPEITGAAEAKMEKQPDNKLKLIVTLNPTPQMTSLNCRIKIPVKSPADWQPLEITIMAQVKDGTLK